MNYDIFFQGYYFGTARNLPEDGAEALRIVTKQFEDFPLYDNPTYLIHIEREE
jgi:hypothetical protein